MSDVAWNDPPADVVWNDWGSPRRVKIERGPVMLFARAVKDDDPVYASEDAALTTGFARIPVPPTYTFVMAHAGAFPDIQTDEPPREVTAEDYIGTGGLFLHGEQHFTYHRQVSVGDVLDGRTRKSEPVERTARRGPMRVTWYQTRWALPDGTPVVDEQIVSLHFPEA